MAADPKLAEYVRQQLGAGVGREQIAQALLNAGWQREQVNEALQISGKEPLPVAPVPPSQSTSESHTIRNALVVIVLLVAAVGALFLLFAAPALFALGVFNPSTYTGRAATGFSGLGLPEDWQYHGTTLTIVFRNGLSQEINLISVESPSCTAYTSQQTIPAGGTLEVSLTGCPEKSPGNSYSQSVTVNYSDSNGLTTTSSGTLTGTVS